MQQAFTMSMRKSITGVHITLAGNFSQQHKENFSALISEAHRENARIFLDVRQLAPMNDSYCQAFKKCYAHIPSRNLYFKGKQGIELGHQGNRVLFMKEDSCKCAGACKSCACQNRAKNRNEKYDFLKKKAQ